MEDRNAGQKPLHPTCTPFFNRRNLGFGFSALTQPTLFDGVCFGGGPEKKVSIRPQAVCTLYLGPSDGSREETGVALLSEMKQNSNEARFLESESSNGMICSVQSPFA